MPRSMCLCSNSMQMHLSLPQLNELGAQQLACVCIVVCRATHHALLTSLHSAAGTSLCTCMLHSGMYLCVGLGSPLL